MARRDTRELILSTSLALFNRLGEPNVTTNLIADEADISPGNLYYHFRHKQDIVEALFTRFAQALAPLLDNGDAAASDAESLWFRLHMIFELKGEFRFLYRNLADIGERMPKVGQALRGLMLRERDSISELFQDLREQCVLEATAGEQSMLRDQLMLTLTYWIPFADLFDPEGFEDGSAQVQAIARIFQLTLPYLSDPFRQETEQLASAYLAAVE